MRDWETLSVADEITKSISGKVVVRCEVNYSDLIFRFTDGSALRIEYDWIYGWELRDSLRVEKEG